ncbi:MAG: major facilitator superfamily 1 [Dehalococcoidia bacterium]|nr:major facilitator superfamily 1 [Dehalococcoidia bacterium]
MLVAITGWQIQMMAQYWLVWKLTNSPLYLGLAGLSQALSTIMLTLFGGVIADRVDRRKLLMLTQGATGLLLFVLATLDQTGFIKVWHILVIAFLIGAVWAFDQPARMALIPHLVPREDLMNAVATGSIIWQGSRIVGPSIAGVLIAVAGTALCFYITAFAFLATILALVLIKVPDVVSAASERNMAHNLVEGLGFIASSPVFFTLIGMTFFNSVFGMSYVILMPVFAERVLGVHSEGYGFLMGISGVGAVLGTTLVAALGNFKHKGWLLLSGGAMFGITLLLFSLSRWYYFSLGLLFLSGGVNQLYMTSVNTLLQFLVPDQLRGRVMGVYSLTWSLLPLGGMLSGGIATLTSAPFAVGLGGIMVAGIALSVMAFLPRVRSL